MRVFDAGQPGKHLNMQVRLGFTMPCDARSVSLVRAACRDALLALGVRGSCIEDIQLAVGEACANVMQHADTTQDYDVTFTVEGSACVVEVVDRGRGFDGQPTKSHEAGPVEPHAENGRGMQLMRAFVDLVWFESAPDCGTSVHLVKSLQFETNAPLDYLSRHPEVTTAP